MKYKRISYSVGIDYKYLDGLVVVGIRKTKKSAIKIQKAFGCQSIRKKICWKGKKNLINKWYNIPEEELTEKQFRMLYD